MNILVTGGAGYIGSHVVKQLLEENKKYNIKVDSVAVIDNLSTGNMYAINTLKSIADENKINFKFIKADLRDFSLIEGIFQSIDFDSIIHFAASIVVPESVKNPLKYYLNNTVNTTNLINLANKYGIKYFIFSSTAAVYGEPEIIPIKESFTPSPINPYGMSKLMSENVLRDTGKANKDFKYIILRYFNVAGADPKIRLGQAFPDATHLIKIASETATGKREKMFIFGTDYNTPDGTCIRDYIHVDDLASAHLKALQYLEKGESDIFNCGYGKGYSVKEVIEISKKVTKVDFKVEITGRREGDPAQLIADNTKITNKMGWRPIYNDLEFICKTAYEWEKKLSNINLN